jgi:hypothetical protein
MYLISITSRYRVVVRKISQRLLARAGPPGWVRRRVVRGAAKEGNRMSVQLQNCRAAQLFNCLLVAGRESSLLLLLDRRVKSVTVRGTAEFWKPSNFERCTTEVPS